VVAVLAASLGLVDDRAGRELTARDLLPSFALDRIRREPSVLDPATLR
jgi:hypothetical protein